MHKIKFVYVEEFTHGKIKFHQYSLDKYYYLKKRNKKQKMIYFFKYLSSDSTKYSNITFY